MKFHPRKKTRAAITQIRLALHSLILKLRDWIPGNLTSTKKSNLLVNGQSTMTFLRQRIWVHFSWFGTGYYKYKTKEQSQPIINYKISTSLKQCVTLEEKTRGEIVISWSQTVSFSDVVYGFVQEDYTEFTDFPSSEDLDVFLAEMELDCENIDGTCWCYEVRWLVWSSTKVEVSRTLPCSEHDLILGDPGTDSGDEGKSKRAEKYIWNEEK